MCNDVHYYITQDEVAMAKCRRPLGDDVMIYSSGSHFHPLPGRYQLPMQEGHYYVRPGISQKDKAHIWMYSRGSGVPYTHRLRYLENPSSRFEYGWYG